MTWACRGGDLSDQDRLVRDLPSSSHPCGEHVSLWCTSSSLNHDHLDPCFSEMARETSPNKHRFRCRTWVTPSKCLECFCDFHPMSVGTIPNVGGLYGRYPSPNHMPYWNNHVFLVVWVSRLVYLIACFYIYIYMLPPPPNVYLFIYLTLC